MHDDRGHFEFLILEGAQAGLSWSTILRKRGGYAQVFARFDPSRVARFTESRARALASDDRIVRNRRKIASAIQNARAFVEVQREFGGFDAYVRGELGGEVTGRPRKRLLDVPATTPAALRLSRDLQRRGFGFVGPTIVYAYMQAVGLVNDHLTGCFRRRQVAEME